MGRAALMAAQLAKRQTDPALQRTFKAAGICTDRRNMAIAPSPLFRRAGGELPASAGVCGSLQLARLELQHAQETIDQPVLAPDTKSNRCSSRDCSSDHGMIGRPVGFWMQGRLSPSELARTIHDHPAPPSDPLAPGGVFSLDLPRRTARLTGDASGASVSNASEGIHEYREGRLAPGLFLASEVHPPRHPVRRLISPADFFTHYGTAP